MAAAEAAAERGATARTAHGLGRSAPPPRPPGAAAGRRAGSCLGEGRGSRSGWGQGWGVSSSSSSRRAGYPPMLIGSRPVVAHGCAPWSCDATSRCLASAVSCRPRGRNVCARAHARGVCGSGSAAAGRRLASYPALPVPQHSTQRGTHRHQAAAEAARPVGPKLVHGTAAQHEGLPARSPGLGA